MEYVKYSSEQLERARNTDIIDFLKLYKGFEFQKQGRYYRCKNADSSSLVVYSDRKGFVWNSQGISGGDAIDYLEKVDKIDFKEAVKLLIGENGEQYQYPSAKPLPEDTAKELILPEKTNEKYSRVYAYLTNTRCLSATVVNDMMKEHKLYQDKKGNCVFVGFDDKNVARFGSVRGTLTEKKYRGDCKNSDKRYAFSQTGKEQDRIYIFEAPIDLLSHCTMTNIIKNDKDAYKQQTRLALCGTSDVALESFLERHKEVKVLNFRLDNDEAGHQQTEKYISKYTAKGYKVNAVFSKGKDVNEDLINIIKIKEPTKSKPIKR